MTIIRLPYIQQFKDRHGKARAYFRRPGCKRVSLPGIPGSTEFMKAYEIALSEGPPASNGLQATPPGSMAALITAYYQSAEFSDFRPSTRSHHRSILERFKEHHGSKQIASLTKSHVTALLQEKMRTPAAANNLLNCLKKLVRIALDRKLITEDFTTGLKKRNYQQNPFATWTETQIATFEAKWPPNSRARLALALLLYTAQRRSDVVRLGPQHVQDGTIELTQVKTGVFLAIPIREELQEILAHHPTNHLAYLTTVYGKPMTPAGFTQWFMECVKKAGLPDSCKPHGLRKAACKRLAESGCTVHEIMAISGHQTLAEVQRYTTAASKRILARSATARVERRHKR